MNMVFLITLIWNSYLLSSSVSTYFLLETIIVKYIYSYDDLFAPFLLISS